MAWKKYISMGISALLALSAGLLTIEKKNVAVKTSGNEIELNTLSEVGTALATFAPYICDVSAVYRDQLDTSDIVRTAVVEKDFKPAYESAKITVETNCAKMFSNNINTMVEIATYYISPDAVYAIFEGIEMEDYEDQYYSGDDSSLCNKANLTAYKAEIYIDENYSLIRLSDSLRLEEMDYFVKLDDIVKVDEYKFVIENIPAGLQKDVWYSWEDLLLTGYTLKESFNSSILFDMAAIILKNEKEFEYFDFNSAITEENWAYVLLSNGAYIYTTDEENDDDRLDEAGIEVCIGVPKAPCIIYDCHYEDTSISTKVQIENVNSITIPKLKNPKIGKIAYEVLQNS